MIINSLYNQIKEHITLKNNIQYQVISIKEDGENTKIHCRFIDTNAIIILTLKDIIKYNKLKYFKSQDILVISKIYHNYSKNNSVNTRYKYFYFLVLIFILCLLSANIAATKIINVFGMELYGGAFIFPMLYILMDILTEVYGFTESRKVIWIGLFSNVFIVIMLYCIALLPASEYCEHHLAFNKIFTLQPIIFFASISSYILGEAINSSIISMLKIKLKGRWFFFRAIISTMIACSLETAMFSFIAFGGFLDYKSIFHLIFTMTLFKICYEILLMPLNIQFVTFLKRTEQVDVYERPSFKGFFSIFAN